MPTTASRSVGALSKPKPSLRDVVIQQRATASRGTGVVAEGLLRTPDEKLDAALLRTEKAREEGRRVLEEVDDKVAKTFYRDFEAQNRARVVLSQVCRWLGILLEGAAALEVEARDTRKRGENDARVASDRIRALEAERDTLCTCLANDLRETEATVESVHRKAVFALRHLNEALDLESCERDKEVSKLREQINHAQHWAEIEAAKLPPAHAAADAAAASAANEIRALKRTIEELRAEHPTALQNMTAKHAAEIAALRQTILIREEHIELLSANVRAVERDAVGKERLMQGLLDAEKQARERDAAAERAEREAFARLTAEKLERSAKVQVRQQRNAQVALQKLEAAKQEQAHELQEQVELAHAQKVAEALALRRQMAVMVKTYRLALGMDCSPTLATSSRSAPSLHKVASKRESSLKGAPHRAAPRRPASPQKSSGSSSGVSSAPVGTAGRARQWLYWQSLRARMDEASQLLDARSALAIEDFNYPSGRSAMQATTLTDLSPAQGDWLPLRSARELAAP